MKKLFFCLAIVIAAIGFTSCSPSFSSKTVEGYWWHSWGHDGLDYVYIKSDGKCDYDFGDGVNKDCIVTIDEKNKTIAVHNNYGIEKTFIYDKEKDVLSEPGAGYEMERISEKDLQENLGITPVVFEDEMDNGYSNEREDETPIFRHESDVKSYLSGVSFSDGEVTLRFKYDGLYANGRLLTGAIVVEEFNEVEAILSCNSPYNGSHMRFHLISDILVKHLNTGEIYYIVK